MNGIMQMRVLYYTGYLISSNKRNDQILISIYKYIVVFILVNMYHIHTTCMIRYFGINHTRFKARCEFFILLFHTLPHSMIIYIFMLIKINWRWVDFVRVVACLWCSAKPLTFVAAHTMPMATQICLYAACVKITWNFILDKSILRGFSLIFSVCFYLLG